MDRPVVLTSILKPQVESNNSPPQPTNTSSETTTNQPTSPPPKAAATRPTTITNRTKSTLKKASRMIRVIVLFISARNKIKINVTMTLKI